MSDESKSLAGAPETTALAQRDAARYPHPIIAREGWPFILVGVIGAGVVHWADLTREVWRNCARFG